MVVKERISETGIYIPAPSMKEDFLQYVFFFVIVNSFRMIPYSSHVIQKLFSYVYAPPLEQRRIAAKQSRQEYFCCSCAVSSLRSLRWFEINLQRRFHFSSRGRFACFQIVSLRPHSFAAELQNKNDISGNWTMGTLGASAINGGDSPRTKKRRNAYSLCRNMRR